MNIKKNKIEQIFYEENCRYITIKELNVKFYTISIKFNVLDSYFCYLISDKNKFYSAFQKFFEKFQNCWEKITEKIFFHALIVKTKCYFNFFIKYFGSKMKNKKKYLYFK